MTIANLITEIAASAVPAIRLVKYIRSHGHEASIAADGTIRALEVYRKDGETHEEWITLKADYETVRAWLGY